jgi:Uma2 family endonuclease
MHAIDVLSHARPRRMSRSEYERVVQDGLFRDERVELIHGIVVEMPPIGPPHADKVDVLTRVFVRAVGDPAVVRIQAPFAASDDSEPEPDCALVPPGRYADRHPDRAFLVVEVSDTTLDHDRKTKGPLYAACGVPEYWIVDVNAREVEVLDELTGDRYGRTRRFSTGATIAPAAFPDVRVQVLDLFG